MRLKLEVFLRTRSLKTGPIFKAKVGVRFKLECGERDFSVLDQRLGINCDTQRDAIEITVKK